MSREAEPIAEPPSVPSRRSPDRTTLDMAPALIWTTNADGTRITFANDRWREYSGRDIVRDGARDLVHPDDREAILACWGRAQASSAPFEMDYRIRRVDGAYRRHAVRALPVRDERGELGGWCGAALDIEASSRDELSFRLLAETIPQLLWVARSDGTIEFWNRRFVEYCGFEPPTDRRARLERIVHRDDRAAVSETWQTCIADGIAFEAKLRLRRSDGVYRWFLSRGTPERDGDGVIVRYVGSATDIDDGERSSRGLAFLERTSDLLGAATDPVSVLQPIAASAVPSIADWCAIYLTDDDGASRPVAMAHRDPDKLAAAWQLVREYLPGDDDTASRRTSAGLSTLFTEIPREIFEAAAVDRRHLDALLAMDIRSAVVAPVVARGRPLGSIRFARGDDRRLGTDEVQIAEIAGKRLGVAIENAHIYERERHISTTFQQAALSRALPSVPGLDLHAVYVAAVREAEIGGDWYDAFALDDGRVVVSIGDVAGKGLEAAVLMGSLRQAIRLLAFKDFAPAEILEAASLLVAREAGERFATAFVGVVDPATWSLRYASAAHPPPIFRRPDGTTLFLQVEPSPPLGLIAGLPKTAMLVSIPPNSMLVLYTDGLVEGTRDIFVGEARLHATVASQAVLHSGDPARLIRDTVLFDGVHDDVAVLTVVFGRSKRWSFDARDAMSAHGARSSFLAALRAEGGRDGDYVGSEVIFGELIGNVVRHAPGPIDVTLDWSEREPVLHVIDRGPGFSREPRLPDSMSESGRGLYIIDTLARSFDASPIPGRGTHVIVRLPVERAGASKKL